VWVGDGLLQLSDQYQMRCRHYEYQMMQHEMFLEDSFEHEMFLEDSFEGDPAFVYCCLQFVRRMCLMILHCG
jgi:hypothetical protein